MLKLVKLVYVMEEMVMGIYLNPDNEGFGEAVRESCLPGEDVIFLNMQHFLVRARKRDVTDYLEQAVIEEFHETYGELFSEQETVLAAVLERIYAKTGKNSISCGTT